MSASASPNQLSPKVIAASLVGVFLTALTAAAAVITPGQVSWDNVVFVFVTALIAALAAWWQSDPLRVNTLVQADAIADAKLRQLLASTLNDQPDGKHEAPVDPAVEGWPKDNKG